MPRGLSLFSPAEALSRRKPSGQEYVTSRDREEPQKEGSNDDRTDESGTATALSRGCMEKESSRHDGASGAGGI